MKTQLRHDGQVLRHGNGGVDPGAHRQPAVVVVAVVEVAMIEQHPVQGVAFGETAAARRACGARATGEERHVETRHRTNVVADQEGRRRRATLLALRIRLDVAGDAPAAFIVGRMPLRQLELQSHAEPRSHEDSGANGHSRCGRHLTAQCRIDVEERSAFDESLALSGDGAGS